MPIKLLFTITKPNINNYKNKNHNNNISNNNYYNKAALIWLGCDLIVISRVIFTLAENSAKVINFIFEPFPKFIPYLSSITVFVTLVLFCPPCLTWPYLIILFVTNIFQKTFTLCIRPHTIRQFVKEFTFAALTLIRQGGGHICPRIFKYLFLGLTSNQAFKFEFIRCLEV